jgi:hypothetical protein
MEEAFSTYGEMRNEYKILVGKPEGKRPFGKARCRHGDNIKTDAKETVLEGTDWSHLTRDSPMA